MQRRPGPDDDELDLRIFKQRKIVVYCSDVSGAFDRVNSERLLEKLRRSGVHYRIVDLIASWLGRRRANVVVGGERSESFLLENMVYQGTVLGPILWNLFFGDASRAIRMLKFIETIFADDLNAYRKYKEHVKNSTLIQAAKKCLERLHEWCRANQAEFDPGKESITILSRTNPFGEGFKIFNIHFDTRLCMEEAISNICDKSAWKLRTLLRTSRFFSTIHMVNLYKSKVLSYVEGKTPAIYHAASTQLQRVDRIQSRFMESAGMNEIDALCTYRLAPLTSRRDMALLGLIHRTVIGLGPKQFQEFFKLEEVVSHPNGRESERKHKKQLVSHRQGHYLEILGHSIFGLVDVYNLLPPYVVETN